ncbi:transposase, partial [Thiolapillus sp.]|uniref:transposase n=1 Tax=Thiolapillus sp. TaxID=2017437 RepID=UPI0035A88088
MWNKRKGCNTVARPAARYLFVGEDRKKATLKAWYESLTEAQREAIESISMDMWPAFINRCQPWRAKRRLVVPSSREAALFSRRALRQRENKVGLRTR